MALADYQINVKFRLAALWTAVMFCYVYGDYFSLYVPGHVQGFIDGEVILDSPGKLLAASILMAVPSLMIFLSVALKPRVNRILNIVFGGIYTLIMLLIATSSLEEWLMFYLFLALLESLITMTIVWHAWKWPEETKA